ncbi:hypothetical protein M5K25_013960 [Dendrobium thyrsiflorum]|uniref:Uncharacterized protein n=1 Tax=Dendrobium thyrsiflorum TaxID=117978 RepID=A0ABD0V171_DENTH
MDDRPDQDPMVPSSRVIVIPGLLSQRRYLTQPDRRILAVSHGAIGEHTGDGHNRNLVVSFGSESPSSEGPGHNRLSCGAIWRQNRRLEDTYHVSGDTSAAISSIPAAPHGRLESSGSRRFFRSKCRNFRSDGKGTSSKERSQPVTKEAKKARARPKVVRFRTGRGRVGSARSDRARLDKEGSKDAGECGSRWLEGGRMDVDGIWESRMASAWRRKRSVPDVEVGEVNNRKHGNLWAEIPLPLRHFGTGRSRLLDRLDRSLLDRLNQSLLDRSINGFIMGCFSIFQAAPMEVWKKVSKERLLEHVLISLSCLASSAPPLSPDPLSLSLSHGRTPPPPYKPQPLSSLTLYLQPWRVCMADPDVEHGFVYDDQGRTDILGSPFFDVHFGTDETVDGYIDRILYQLFLSIEEHISPRHWYVINRLPTSPTLAIAPTMWAPKIRAPASARFL